MHKNEDVIIDLNKDNKFKLYFKASADSRYFLRLTILNSKTNVTKKVYKFDRFACETYYEDRVGSIYLKNAMKILSQWLDKQLITEKAYQWAVNKSYVIRTLYK